MSTYVTCTQTSKTSKRCLSEPQLAIIDRAMKCHDTAQVLGQTVSVVVSSVLLVININVHRCSGATLILYRAIPKALRITQYGLQSCYLVKQATRIVLIPNGCDALASLRNKHELKDPDTACPSSHLSAERLTTWPGSPWDPSVETVKHCHLRPTSLQMPWRPYWWTGSLTPSACRVLAKGASSSVQPPETWQRHGNPAWLCYSQSKEQD